MTAAPSIGTFLPESSRMWRNPAHFSGALKRGFAWLTCACQRDVTASASPSPAGAEYHFRTPSPGGQQTPIGALLPVSFRTKTMAWRIIARNRMSFDCDLQEPLDVASVSDADHGSKQGAVPCASNQQPLRPPSLWQALRLVGTQWVNKLSLAALLVPVPQPSQAVASSQVRPSARLAICSTASSTPANADTQARLTRFHSHVIDSVRQVAGRSFCVLTTLKERPHV